MPNADFAQRFRLGHQLLDEVFRRGCGKCLVEFDDEQMPYSEVANQFDLMLRGREQMGVRRWGGALSSDADQK
jgi:hypothetical protein